MRPHPQIAALGPDLLAGATNARAAADATGPVFAGLVGGVGQLPAAVAATGGIEVRLDSTVRAITRTSDGWRLSVGPTTDVEHLDVDAVVVAAPAPAAARLIAEDAPDAAFALAAIEYASMAIVTYVFDEPPAFDGSGFLVPPVDHTFIKAATVSSNKWEWVAATGRTVIRASVGRAGEATLLQNDDGDIAARALVDLRTAFGGLPEPARLLSSSGGVAGCRSTTSGTSIGSRSSSVRSPQCRGSSSAARPTTGSASPRSSPRVGRLLGASSTLGQSRHERARGN